MLDGSKYKAGRRSAHCQCLGKLTDQTTKEQLPIALSQDGLRDRFVLVLTDFEGTSSIGNVLFRYSPPWHP